MNLKNVIEKVKKSLKQFRGLFPSALPQGRAEFDTWLNDIVATYALPTILPSDIQFVFSTEVMRLGPQAASKPKYYFVLALRAAAAKQVAGSVFHEVKTRQQQELAQRQSEVTAEKAVTSNGSGQA